MALKVKTSYQPKIGLKVTTKPVSYVSVGANIAPQNTNVQSGSAPKNLPNAVNYQRQNNPVRVFNSGQALPAGEAERLRRETDAILAGQVAEKKRLSDAKQTELAGYQGNLLAKLKDKVTFGADTRARNSRELAYQYYTQNEKKWGSQILARQRNYEVKAGSLKQWVLQADSEDDYNKRIKEAMGWLDSEYKGIDDDIKDFRNTQLELSTFAQTPLSSKVAGAGRFSKDFFSRVGSQTWGALSAIASQPERGVNTIKNFVNPNNKRLYYGGDEKKQPQDIIGQGSNPFSVGWNQLKNSYNQSKDQRILGFDKEDEARRLASGGVKWAKNKNTGEWEKFTVKSPSLITKGMTKYGDDVVNLLADPLNFLPNQWASKAGSKIKKSEAGQQVSRFISSKGDDFFKWAGKHDKVSDFLISREARKANPNTFSKWLNRKVGTTKNDFFSDNKKIIEYRKKLGDELSQHASEWKNIKNETWGTVASRLKSLDDDEARILQEFILPQTFANQASDKVKKAIYNWDQVQVPRGFDKSKRRFIEDLARDLKKRTDDLRLFGIDVAQQQGNYKRADLIRKANNKSYIPYYSGITGNNSKLDKSVNQADWFLKAKTGYGKQSADQLTQSFQKRFISQLYGDSSAGQWLGQNAEDYSKRIKDTTKYLGWREQGYKPKFGNKVNEALLKNKFSPTKLWKKSVLALNPAWYANNIATNIPFSISGGGAGVVPEYLKMLKKAGRNFSDIPEGVRGNIDEFVGGGRLGKLGSKVEDTSRIATFRALKKRGFSDEKAIKEVNRWLFDYSTKNWERPIKTVAPFYKWQANLMRLSAQMPFTNPRSAKFYNSFQQQFFERPLNQLPNETQEYVDPDTGQTKSYNPREAYKGKMFVGTDKDGNPKFANMPSWALNPNTLTDFGLNPALSLFQDVASSQDRFGNLNTDKSVASLLADKFPQAGLAKSLVNRDNKDSKMWFADSGNSKWKQGFDTDKPNYDKTLDNQEKFKKRLKSFFAVPNTTTFNKKEYDVKQRLTKFNTEFFEQDWQAKEEANYSEAQKEKKAMAEKYGFDLQKDIYDNYWSKYDTKTTTDTKAKKQDAYKFSSDFWRDYYSKEKGSLTSPSERRPFLIEKFREWAKNNTFAENGYRKLPEINPFTLERQESESKARRATGKAKYNRFLEYQKAKKSGDWSWFDSNGRSTVKKSSPFQFDGKYFKTAESMKKYETGKFWRDYYAEKDLKKRQALLDANPQYRTFEQPQTQEEWDIVKALLRKQRNEKLSSMNGFTSSRMDIKKQIEQSAPRAFGRSKRLRYKF